jgi:uncharacterized protein HemY
LLAYVGAARAAAKAGASAKARLYYARVVQLAARADTVRAEVAEARAFVGKKSGAQRAQGRVPGARA